MKRIMLSLLMLTCEIALAQAPVIDISFSLTDNAGGTQQMRLGLDPTATDGIDASLGEAELPPFPPSSVFDARFVGEDISVPQLGQGTYKDYRTGDFNFNGTKTHEIKFQPGNGTTVTINWQLPDGVTGLLQDLFGGVLVNQQMTGDGNYTVTNPGAINKLKIIITYGTTPSESLTLTAPNGGEVWQAGSVQSITWESSGMTNVAIDFSIDCGTNWVVLTGSTLATSGDYSWTVPNSSTTRAKIRIRDASDGTPTDESDLCFTISGATGVGVDVPITVTDNVGGTQTLSFGLDLSATDGLDASLGEAELPPFPPSGVFDARFVGDDVSLPQLGQGTYRDFRTGDASFNGTKTHEIKFQPGNGTTIAISWQLPDGVSGLLQDLFGGVIVNQPMSGDGNYTVTNPGAIGKLKMIITYAPAPSESLNLSEPNGGEVWQAGSVQNITWQSSGITNVAIEYSIDGGVNWVTVAASTSAAPGNFSWIIPDTPTAQAKVRIRDASDDLPSDESDLVFSISGLTSAAVDIPITITDNTGQTKTLRFGFDPAASNGIDLALGEAELPPFPPSGVFEARFVGDDISVPQLGQGSYSDYRPGDANLLGLTTYELRFQPATGGTITINWNLPVQAIGLLQDVITGALIAEELRGQGGYTVSNGAINKLKITLNLNPVNAIDPDLQEIAADFNLAQNYPNPFNPETTIEFALIRAGRVKIQIYNILGQPIRTLLDEQLDAGVKKLKWDGRDEAGLHVPSGIYLYQIRVADFVASRKLILMR